MGADWANPIRLYFGGNGTLEQVDRYDESAMVSNFQKDSFNAAKGTPFDDQSLTHADKRPRPCRQAGPKKSPYGFNFLIWDGNRRFPKPYDTNHAGSDENRQARTLIETAK